MDGWSLREAGWRWRDSDASLQFLSLSRASGPLFFDAFADIIVREKVASRSRIREPISALTFTYPRFISDSAEKSDKHVSNLRTSRDPVSFARFAANRREA